MAFKTAALVLYLIGSWILPSSFIFLFVVIVLLAAFDFWVVKNVSGRLLVGLRWWNQILPSGESIWHFENLHTLGQDGTKSRIMPNRTDSFVFWWSFYIFIALWSLFSILCLLQLHFQWLILTIILNSLLISNFYAYYKCDKESTKQLTAQANNILRLGQFFSS